MVDADGPTITDPWKVSEACISSGSGFSIPLAKTGSQIVYCSIMGVVMLAALLEWFLWLAAFLYCLVKVFQKADKWHIRVLSVIMMLLFSALR